MGRYASCNYALMHVIRLWKSEVLRRGHVTDKISPCHACVSCPYGTCNMVIPRSHIGNYWAKQVKRSVIGEFLDALYRLLHKVQRNVARALDHGHDTAFERALLQFSKNLLLPYFKEVRRILDGAGTHAVSEAKHTVILFRQVQEPVVLFIKGIFPAGILDVCRCDGAATGYNAFKP